MTYIAHYRPGHRAMTQSLARGLSTTAALAAIRALETAGVLTPAVARDARSRTFAERARDRGQGRG